MRYTVPNSYYFLWLSRLNKAFLEELDIIKGEVIVVTGAIPNSYATVHPSDPERCTYSYTNNFI